MRGMPTKDEVLALAEAHEAIAIMAEQYAQTAGLKIDWPITEGHIPVDEIPNGFRLIDRTINGASYSTSTGLLVIFTGLVYQDHRRWLHISVSRRKRLPSWPDLVAVRDRLLGPGKKVLQVLPASEEHVSIHDYCLHLWHCLDDEITPDFTLGSGQI